VCVFGCLYVFDECMEMLYVGVSVFVSVCICGRVCGRVNVTSMCLLGMCMRMCSCTACV